MPEFDSTIAYCPISGFSGYVVGSDGTVWSNHQQTSPNVNGKCVGARYVEGSTWRELALTNNRTGYPRAALYRNDGKQVKALVHLLVLEAFVGPRPDGMEGLHGNGIKSDCRRDNLRWGTPVENWEDRRKHGAAANMAKGEGHGMARLTEVEVREMLSMSSSGYSPTSIANRFHISLAHACRIVDRKAWKHISTIG